MKIGELEGALATAFQAKEELHRDVAELESALEARAADSRRLAAEGAELTKALSGERGRRERAQAERAASERVAAELRKPVWPHIVALGQTSRRIWRCFPRKRSQRKHDESTNYFAKSGP